MSTLYLADTSAWARSARPEIAGRWERLVDEETLAICAPVRLELLYSAPNAPLFERIQRGVDALP